MPGERLPRLDSTANRLSVYAGFFDIANDRATWSEIEDALKFAALFYQWIIVPDGFFHCYGPLFDELRRYVKKAGAINPPADQLAVEYPILAMLRAGIIVPAIREGDSIYENWALGRGNVKRGVYMTVRAEDGEYVLKMVDAYTKYFVEWPDKLNPDVKRRQSSFSHHAKSIFLDKGSEFWIANPDIFPNNKTEFVGKQEKQSVEKMFYEFGEMLCGSESDPHFRRGDVEKFIERQTGVRLTSYSELSKRIDWTEPEATFLHSNAYLLLTATTTAYELMQAAEFDAVASLFPLYEFDVIRTRQLHKALYEFSPASGAYARRPLEFDSLDVSRISLRDVMSIRRRQEFDKYLELLSAIKLPTEGNSFWDANSDYVEYVQDNYLTAIAAKYPHAEVLGRNLNAAADIQGAQAGIIKTIRDHVEVFSEYAIFAVSEYVKTAKPVATMLSVRDRMRRKTREERFRKHNHAFWGGKALKGPFPSP